MKTCDELQGYIFDRVLGESLPPTAEEAVSKHLRCCPACRKIHEDARKVWGSLEAIKEVRFPRSLSRNVLGEAVFRPAFIRFFGRPLSFRQASLIAAAATVVIASGLLLVFHGFHPGEQAGRRTFIREAGTFHPRQIPSPDLTVTLDDYLEKTRNILGGVRDGAYNTWGSVLSEIISRDIQGRSNYLLENSALPPAARPVVGSLHDAFWRMLQCGRGRETEEIRLPPGIDPSALVGEIDRYKCLK
ncbi:MAG: hypothetical protein V1789_00185 [PVC group bacterium]